MTAPQRFISYAQNAEDVVLWRALGHLPSGRYLEVGANDPTVDSISRSFYDRGWRGLEIEPVQEFVERFRQERPEDLVVHAAVTSEDVETVTLHVIDGTGLSTLDSSISSSHRRSGLEPREVTVPARRLDAILTDAGWQPEESLHFMVVDTEGAERSVLESIDLKRWRPWVLVIEATAPNSTRATHEHWEQIVLDAGYEYCLFDGLSRFYVAAEHAAELGHLLRQPASPVDAYTTRHVLELEQRTARLESERETLLGEVVRWRGAVLARWSEAIEEIVGTPGTAGGGHEAARLRAELEAMQSTVSWRVTRPLRTVRDRQLRGGRRA